MEDKPDVNTPGYVQWLELSCKTLERRNCEQAAKIEEQAQQIADIIRAFATARKAITNCRSQLDQGNKRAKLAFARATKES